jgi:hypothetical protein
MMAPAPCRQILLLAATATFACSATPADPVEELRTELESAAEARDAERFAEGLSESFRGPRGAHGCVAWSNSPAERVSSGACAACYPRPPCIASTWE